jgi:hypothetical protein
MKRILIVALFFGLVLGTIAPAMGSAAIHFPNDNAWGDDGFEIDDTRAYPFGTTSFYFRSRSAADTWSAISGSGLDFIYDGQRSMSPTLAVGNVTFDETWIMDYWTSGAGGKWDYPSCGSTCAFATTEISGGGSGIIDRALIRVNHDDQLPWYQGTGTPSGTQYDLLSTMVHEVGHAAGGLDFYGSERTNLYTMCGTSSVGSTYKRSISAHEIADMAAKY